MNRERAYEELIVRVEQQRIIKHSLAVEAIMRKLAEYLQQDTHIWGLAGLLHDIDLDKVKGDLEKHGLIGAEILEGLNVDPTIIYAVKSHNPNLGYERKRKIDKALFCADPLSGFITACAMIKPQKKLENVDTNFCLKKFKEKSFAKGANRDQLETCSELDLTLEQFITIGLDAMKEISRDLGM